MPWGPKWNQQSSFILKSGSPLIQVKAVEAAKKSTSSSPPQWAPSAKQMLLNGIICLFFANTNNSKRQKLYLLCCQKIGKLFWVEDFLLYHKFNIGDQYCKSFRIEEQDKSSTSSSRIFFTWDTHCCEKPFFVQKFRLPI